MDVQSALSRARVVTVIGLVIGTFGIAILWMAGVEFPIFPPPGIVILLTGALFVAFAPWRWAPSLGAFLGLFVLVGFLISPLGIPHILGEHGTAKQIGQAVQVLGVVTALVAGVLATRANYRGQTSTVQQQA